MAIVVGTDTWVTVDEADAYLTYRMGAGDWFALLKEGNPGNNSKESVLGTAFRELLNCPTLNLVVSSSGDAIKNAQCEMALFLTEHYDEFNDRRAAIATGLNSFSMSKRREDLRTYFVGVPEYIVSMLSAYSEVNTFVDLVSPYDI